MPNIFGNLNEGLTNPLTENLDGGGYKIIDLANPTANQDAVTLNYYNSNLPSSSNPLTADLDGAGFKITNIANPTANQDGVTLAYYNANLPSVITPYYDLWAAYGDETTPIVAGVQPAIIYAPRDFTATSITASLSAVATSNSFAVQVKVNSTVIGTLTFLSGSPNANIGITPDITILQNQLITANCVSGDATAAGLKICILGTQL